MARGVQGVWKRAGAALVAALCLLGGWASSFAADRLTLKDGRVLEGRIQREEKDFVYLVVKIGSLEKVELVLREQIEKIEREAEKAAPAGKPEAKPSDKPSPAASGREGEKAKQSDAAKPAGNATRIAFIPLGDPPLDMVGIYMSAGALRESIKRLEQESPDIVVLQINSGGGIANEVQKLSDVIEKEMKPKFRTVAWIQSAISAAAMTAITMNEIYFMPKGNLGAATMFSMTGARQAKAAEGRSLEEILFVMEKISKRGGYDPLLMRAMQVETELSADIDADGAVRWRNDLGGQYKVSDGKGILTLNSQDAMRYKFAKGVADTKADLAKLLVGDAEWVEVGKSAADYQAEYREATHQSELALNRLFRDLEQAINKAVQNLQNAEERSKSVGQARRVLGELKSIAQRSPGLREYRLPDRLFKGLEEALRRIQAGEQVDVNKILAEATSEEP